MTSDCVQDPNLLLAPGSPGAGMTLDRLERGRAAVITGVDWSGLAEEEARRLRALGLDAGACVTVAHRGVFAGRDPLAIEIGRMTVALRRVHAAAMSVEVL